MSPVAASLFLWYSQNDDWRNLSNGRSKNSLYSIFPKNFLKVSPSFVFPVWDLYTLWVLYVFTHKSIDLQVCHNRAIVWGLYTPPPFPGGLRADSDGLNLSRMPIFWLWNCWNCPVTFRWLSGACSPDWLSPTDFPADWPLEYHQTSCHIPLEMTGQQWKVQRKSGGLQRTPSRQLSLLVLLIKNENWINKPKNTLY